MSLTGIFLLLAAVFSGALAWFVLGRDARSFAHRSFALGMCALAAESVFSCLSVESFLPENMVFWQRLRLGAMASLPGLWLLFSLSYSRGNYRELLVRWRFVILAAFVLPLGCALGFSAKLVTNAVPLQGTSWWVLQLGWPGAVLHALLLLGAVLILAHLEGTLRASTGTMRWQIKFLVLGLGVLFAVRIYSSSQALLYTAADLSLENINAGALLVAEMLVVASLFRARLFNVDIYPSHSFLYNSLTVLLSGVYLLTVGLLAKLVSFLGGDAAFPFKAFFVLVSILLLALLLLSDRLRLRLRRFVSRHLKRPHYDYRRVWADFTERTTTLMNVSDLCRAVAHAVSETLQVLSVTVWQARENEQQLVLGGSTSLPGAGAVDLSVPRQGTAELIRVMKQAAAPVDIDRIHARWLDEFKRCNPDFFPDKGGNRVCVPLIAGDELLGLMLVGDRVSGVPFSLEEFDLLKTIGDQVAGQLHNLKLSERLLEAKQMEAFQMMSTFFVHDLKNTASTLSLMLQNLPVHFEDPAFREDALRAIGKSVSRINDLIRRLTLLRQKLELRPAETDLNELVTATLDGLDGTHRPRVDPSLQTVPRVSIDREQVQNVLTNLVLNAYQATAPDGRITVATAYRDGWAVVSVSDTGCGMTPGFMQRSLFRPFQTTKKDGMGIGLFHSKLIVEAHQGKLEVESEEGKGSTFRVLLPTTGGPG